VTSKNDPASTSEDAIRQRAYLMWEADGRPDGMAEHYWMRAAAPDAAVQPAAAETARKVGVALDAMAEAETPKARKAKSDKSAADKDAGKAARKKSAGPTAAKPAGKAKSAAVKLSTPAVKAKVASKPPSRKAVRKD
jgi:hypothetical protein